ncbi:hypothetical protein NW755_008374, partial [Fusarium falciforme]
TDSVRAIPKKEYTFRQTSALLHRRALVSADISDPQRLSPRHHYGASLHLIPTVYASRSILISSLIKMPGSHSSSIQSSPRSMRLVTSQDLYTSINATLTSKDNRPSTPVHHIQENDYTVPAPPPPSPVSFRPEHWPTSIRR